MAPSLPEKITIHDKKQNAVLGKRPMGTHFVGNHVAFVFSGKDLLTGAKFRYKFTLQAMDNMALFAPMVRFVICRIFHEANPKSAKLQRLPPGSSGFSLVFGFFDGGPVDALEGDFHRNLEKLLNSPLI